MKLWRIPLDAAEVQVPQGEIHVIFERCKGCSFCVEYCPRDVLRISEQFNKKGYHYPEVINGAVCVDCNLCEAICPEFAIYSIPVEPDEKESPKEENAQEKKS